MKQNKQNLHHTYYVLSIARNSQFVEWSDGEVVHGAVCGELVTNGSDHWTFMILFYCLVG